MTFELFDFVKMIQGVIAISGEFSTKWSFLNVHVTKNGRHFEITENSMLISFFGRSESMDVDEALAQLARSMSGRTIKSMSDGLIYQVPNLTHTKGYRG